MEKVERAIIMAAGLGSRLQPITFETPKPLIEVKGVSMIESIIGGLHVNGITEIYIVVGYKKEMFSFLATKYEGVILIENPYYKECNNISSLYVARDYIANSIILDGDQVVRNPQILTNEFQRSGYNAVWFDGTSTNEWLMTVEDNIVISCSRTGGAKGWQLYGISRWTKEDAIKLRKYVVYEFEVNKNYDLYWDDIALFSYPNDFELGIMQMAKEDVIEIDTIEDLQSYNY